MGLFSFKRNKPRRKRQSVLRNRSGVFSLLRFAGPGVTVGGVLAFIGSVLTGNVDLSMFDPRGEDPGIAQTTQSETFQSTTPTAFDTSAATRITAPSPQAAPTPNGTYETIRVASFNIKMFGPSKAANPVVMNQIASIVSQFDVIGLQEVHGTSAESIKALVTLLRTGGAPFAASVSEKIGTKEYSESYAFLWNEKTIELIPGSDYVVSDPEDKLPREPMVASFRCRLNPTQKAVPFSFTLINSHTSPSGVAPSALDNEMNVLDDVFLSVADYSYQNLLEDDCIILGDLNVDTKGLRELGMIPNLKTVTGKRLTNTRQTETYDHILVDKVYTAEFTGKAGVFNLQRELKLDLDAALEISDHFPVWAEFTKVESRPAVSVSSRTTVIR
jgi:deoxyribonuclease-1-like protein